MQDDIFWPVGERSRTKADAPADEDVALVTEVMRVQWQARTLFEAEGDGLYWRRVARLAGKKLNHKVRTSVRRIPEGEFFFMASLIPTSDEGSAMMQAYQEWMIGGGKGKIRHPPVVPEPIL